MLRIGRGGGDRTTCGVEDAQVIDSTKREKGEKPQIRLTEYTRGTRISLWLELGGADGIVSRPLKKTEEKPLNSRLIATY
jgi:hypothetical protein